MRRLPLALAVLAMPAALQAKWLEASSSHFVIYADERPDEIRQFSEQLERFHGAMALLLRAERPLPSPSNRVTIYIVKSDSEVRRLFGLRERFVYAAYRARAGASLAIVPRVNARVGATDFSMIALLHEYAHHFQLSAAGFPLPRWFVEGHAEFFASAKFERDGSLSLGMPAGHRGPELLFAPDVHVRALLDPDGDRRRDRGRYDAYYGKSWLLYHYLTFSSERAGQLAQYVRLLQEGTGSAEAARSVFGDFGKLEQELEKYLRQRMMMSFRLPPSQLNPGPVAIRELGAGEAEMMPVRMRSHIGVTQEQAAGLLPEARAVAARHPRDAAVLAALAEAEHDAGHDDAAIAAADAAIALDPTQVNAYVQKGFSLFRKAGDAEDKAKAYRDARAPFLALNKLENDHPLPLIYYYMSFGRQGVKPAEVAVQALERAAEVAPFDLDLRRMLAYQQIADKRFEDAIANLAPIAYNPHGGEGAERSRRLLDRLRSGEDLDGLDPAAFGLDQPAADDGEPEGEE